MSAAATAAASSAASSAAAGFAEQHEQQITFLIPAGVRPGTAKLSVDAGSEKLLLPVPVGATPGDKVVLSRSLPTTAPTSAATSPTASANSPSSRSGAGGGPWRCVIVREKAQTVHNPDERESLISSGSGGSSPGASPSSRSAFAADEAYARLVEAARAGGCFVSNKVKRGRAPPLNIPGLVAAAPIEAGEELLIFPERFHIHAAAVQRLLPELWQTICDLQDVPALRRNEVVQTVFLARLLQEADRGSDGSTEFAEQDEPVLAVWRRYIDALLIEDWGYHPYWRAAAEPADFAATFAPSPEAEFLADMVQDTCAIHRAVRSALAARTAPCGGRGGERLPVDDGLEANMFLRGRLSVLSRVFQTNHDSTLVPVVDFFNHAPDSEPMAAWRWEESRNAMVVTAERDIDKGEEIFVSYGPRSNVLLYRTYGFTLEPSVEPSWTYIVRPNAVKPIYDMFMPKSKHDLHVVLESREIDPTLCEAMNAVSSEGRDVGDFLRLVFARCRWPYEHSEKLRPLFAALAESRRSDPQNFDFWTRLSEEHRDLVSEDAVRIAMSEYLCLTAHLEVLDLVDLEASSGSPASADEAEARCLPAARAMRPLFRQSIQLLRKGRGFSVRFVPETAAGGADDAEQ